MRKFLHEWLLSMTAARAYTQLVIAFAVGLLWRRVSGKTGSEWIIVRLLLDVMLLLLLSGPVGYFVLPPLFFCAITLLIWLKIRFGKETAEFPCPVCGYDIRVTPHRCPECGTKLRWGQLEK